MHVMIAAVSPVVSRTPAALTPAPTGYPWIKGLPDLNRQTARLIGESGAGWTFTTICRLLHHIGRIGRPRARQEAKERQRLSVGLAAVAEEAGLSIGKVRRDCTKLAKLGLIVTIRPNVTMERDLETGRLKENRTGRSKATVIVLTVCQEHLRQKASPPVGQAVSPTRMAPSSPTRLGGLPAHDSVHPGGAIQRDRNTKRTPDGLAVGIGQPQAEGEAGLPAGPAGGQEAAGEGRLPAAGQEEGTVPLRIVVADDADEQAHLPPGRLTPQAAKPREPQRRTWGGQWGQGQPSSPPLSSWSADELAALRRQRERLEAEQRDLDQPRQYVRPASLPPRHHDDGVQLRPAQPGHKCQAEPHRKRESTFDHDRAKAEALAALTR
jgi:hypothetical protein